MALGFIGILAMLLAGQGGAVEFLQEGVQVHSATRFRRTIHEC